MANFINNNISIIGMSASVPKNKSNVEDFATIFGEEAVNQFIKSTGIKSIHRANEKQTAGDLAYEAANNLLGKLNIDKTKIGILVFVTQSPDYRRPATACVLQHRLGLPQECASMDVGLGCSGFLYGQQMIMSLLETSEVEYGLLLLGETASKLVNPNDKSIAMMYGDAGVAILYGRSKSEDIKTSLYTDGSRFKSIVLPAGGFRDFNPPCEEYLCSDGIKRSKYDIHMDGISVFIFSTTDVPKSIVNYFDNTKTSADDYDFVVLHQANQFIVNQIAKKIKVKKEKLLCSLDKFGNTGGMSIPLTICNYFGNNAQGIKHILASGFGIGLSWGITSFYLDTSRVLPILETDEYFSEGIIEVDNM